MKKRLILIIVFLWGIIFLNDVFSMDMTENKRVEEMSVEEILSLLNHSDWRMQEKVIGPLSVDLLFGKTKTLTLYPLNNEKIRLAIIKALEKINNENEKLEIKWVEYYETTGQEPPPDWKPEGIIMDDGYGELQLQATYIVGEFKDERAIPALVGAVECGASINRAIIEFGELAVRPLLERLEKTKDRSAKSDIIEVLGKIAKKGMIISQVIEGTPTTKAPFKALTVSQIELMKNAFIKSLNDPCPFTRMEAIRGLEILGDTSAIPLLKQIAENDPCKWGTVDPVTKAPKKGYYPVREEAQRVIKLLEEKKKEEETRKETENKKKQEKKGDKRVKP